MTRPSRSSSVWVPHVTLSGGAGTDVELQELLCACAEIQPPFSLQDPFLPGATLIEHPCVITLKADLQISRSSLQLCSEFYSTFPALFIRTSNKGNHSLGCTRSHCLRGLACLLPKNPDLEGELRGFTVREILYIDSPRKHYFLPHSK